MFRIYYADGSEYEGPPEDAPVRGVICILQRRADGRYHIADRKSHYVWDTKEWLPCTWDDVEEFLLDRREIDIVVIRGRVIGHKEYQDIFNKAKEDLRRGRHSDD